MQNSSYKLDTNRLLGLRLLQQNAGKGNVLAEKILGAKVGVNGKGGNNNNQQT